METAKAASQQIIMQREQLSHVIVVRQWELDPELATRFDEAGRTKCIRDVQYNLDFLAQAVAIESPTLFTEYIAWVKVLFDQLHIPATDLELNLKIMQEALLQLLPAEDSQLAAAYVARALTQLPEMPTTLPTFIDPAMPLGSLAQRYLLLLLRGDRHMALELIVDAVNQGVRIQDIYLQVFQASQYEIGRLWQTNQISVAQEHYCSAAVQLIMAQLYPRILASQKNGRRMVAVCVAQEIHELGLRMVADFFEMEGWDTQYFGANVPTRSAVTAASEWNADVLAISATMTFHVDAVVDLIEQVRIAIPQIKILVGGYPFKLDPDLWRRVGADGYATNAKDAVEIANALMTPARDASGLQ